MAIGHSIIPPFPDDIDRDAFGHWLSGFTDGEGSFLLFWHRNRQYHSLRVGVARFTIGLRDDDRPILELIRSFWGCGTVRARHRSSGRPNVKPASAFEVDRIDDLADVVTPHFDRFPLRAKKSKDFAIWRHGVDLIRRIKQRQWKGRTLLGGRLPKWGDGDLSDFRHLHDALRESRCFNPPAAPAVEMPPVLSDRQETMW